MKFANVTLEVSTKPFLRREAGSFDEVSRTLFRQWLPLTLDADTVAVQLWVGDGSEILEFSGDLDGTFDWARYVGSINAERTDELRQKDPENRHAACCGVLFEEGTAPMSCRTLLELVRSLKRVGREVTGKSVLVGDSFDPGPEFAISKFKYKTHPETLKGGYGFAERNIISCWSRLRGDSDCYAGYPGGVPDGTPFGEFLGRQAECFLTAMEMDFIWFSNGFGFGNYPWIPEGVLFDGKRFDTALLKRAEEEMKTFWNAFRRECAFPVTVRGSNYSAGIELASDGVPLKWIFDGGFIAAPPVNSPWSALVRDFGAELTGWMSHLAGFPEEKSIFRFYVQDPWFTTRPWLECYDSQPGDIYMPMSVARLRRSGAVEVPSQLNLLTIDDCRGNLPALDAEEVIPCLHRARLDAPDAPGPFVWVYPFEEYHRWITPEAGRIDEVMAGDLFMRAAVNRGFPLNTVVSTADFTTLPVGCVAVSPVPEAGSDWEARLFRHAEQGGGVLLYGPLRHAGERLRAVLGVNTAPGLTGEFTLSGVCRPECFDAAMRLTHNAAVSAGALEEVGGAEVLAELRQGTQSRTFAVEAEYGAGRIQWIRGSVDNTHSHYILLTYRGEHGMEQRLEAASLMPLLAARFGWKFDFRLGDPRNFPPAITLSCHANGFFYSGFNQTATTEQHLATPFGAPVFTATDFTLQNGEAVCRFEGGWHKECRVFVRQESGLMSCHRAAPILRGKSHALYIRGLQHGQVCVFVPPGAEATFEAHLDSDWMNCCDRRHALPWHAVEERGHRFLQIEGDLSGTLLLLW